VTTELSNRWIASTQPWPDKSADDLVKEFSNIGFDGIELPVRDGFPVTPGNVAVELQSWSRTFLDAGLSILSVAGDPSGELLDACAAAHVPVIRVMAPIVGNDYLAAVDGLQKRFESWVPLCERTGVRIAVQQHHGRFVSTSSGLRSLLDPLPKQWIGAGWDAGHSALAGEDADLSLSQLADRLVFVNLRNGHYARPSTDGAGEAWTMQWVAGNEGMGDWASAAASLQAIGYGGTICLAGQYTHPVPDVITAVRGDLSYVRNLFEH
jgi:sugar phosphate isomerase/epimerase